MSLIGGRKFSEDRISDQGRVGVISQEAADLYFNGKPFGAGVIDDSGVRSEIIGVCFGVTKEGSVVRLDDTL